MQQQWTLKKSVTVFHKECVVKSEHVDIRVFSVVTLFFIN